MIQLSDDQIEKMADAVYARLTEEFLRKPFEIRNLVELIIRVAVEGSRYLEKQ